MRGYLKSSICEMFREGVNVPLDIFAGDFSRCNLQANATHCLLPVSSFNCGSNIRFTIGAPASFTRFLATDEKFINFNLPGELFAIPADGTASALL